MASCYITIYFGLRFHRNNAAVVCALSVVMSASTIAANGDGAVNAEGRATTTDDFVPSNSQSCMRKGSADFKGRFLEELQRSGSQKMPDGTG